MLRAKARRKHGGRSGWLKANVRVSQAQAYRYMEFGKLLTVRSLSLDEQLAEWRRICGRGEYMAFAKSDVTSDLLAAGR